MTERLQDLLSKKGIEEIDMWVAKYPREEKQSAVMRALMVAQEEFGYLTQALMDGVAEYLHMPNIAVYEVATFYSMYEHKPVGKHCINVCSNISCKLNGAQDVINHLEEVLQVRLGETTQNKQFTLRAVECLGACAGAPMMQVDKTYYENLTPEKIDKIIKKHK